MNDTDDRKFTDADIRAAIRIFFEILQQEFGKGIFKALWSMMIGFIVACFIFGLLLKLKLPWA